MVLLSAITAGLSVIALVRILSTTTAARNERARDAVRDQVERLASGAAVTDSPSGAVIGMRGGVLGPDGLHEIPPLWREAYGDALKTQGVVERSVPGATLLLAVRPTATGKTAWAGFVQQPPAFLRSWQIIVVLIALATALLVATALHTLFTFQKNLTRSQAEEQRLATELAHKERLAALGRVVAGVAHEVRNPLASIKLQLDLSAAGGALEPQTLRAITFASEEITRLDRLVADLLVVAGRQPSKRETVPVGELVRARVGALQPWSATRQVSIATSGEATAAVDRESVGRAIDNLLRNAVEASPGGQVVDVHVATAEQAVRVRVVDRGAGVSDERAGELFEPFFTTKPDGTGLGLAISRAIARAHGGDLTYARDGATTRFDLVLSTTSTS